MLNIIPGASLIIEIVINHLIDLSISWYIFIASLSLLQAIIKLKGLNANYENKVLLTTTQSFYLPLQIFIFRTFCGEITSIPPVSPPAIWTHLEKAYFDGHECHLKTECVDLLNYRVQDSCAIQCFHFLKCFYRHIHMSNFGGNCFGFLAMFQSHSALQRKM